MMIFLLNNGSTILIGLGLLVVVALILFKLRKDCKNGRSSCGCDCGNCAASGMCHK